MSVCHKINRLVYIFGWISLLAYVIMISMNIKSVKARQIIDSRGNPTVEADVTLDSGATGRAGVPSGASTGTHEALELRDKTGAYGGLGVMNAVNNINNIIAHEIVGTPSDQVSVDNMLKTLDGTPNKSKLGANAILAVSLAVAKASAVAQNVPLYKYVSALAGNTKPTMPTPMINIINGGKHASGSTDIQEFMIMPIGAKTFGEAVQMGAEVFHALGQVLKDKGYSNLVGDEGGYAPSVKAGNREALDLIIEAIKRAKYTPGKDVVLALDVAASELFKDGKYILATEQKQLSSDEMIEWYKQLISNYPIVSIEDGLDQEDWAGWQKMTTTLGDKIQLVGDDLLVTNTAFLKRAIDEKAATAILIKPNQIGTLSETIEAVIMAKAAGWRTILSHRSGETEDTTIAHLAVGLATGYIKTGSVCRGERTAKYNELIRIEETL